MRKLILGIIAFFALATAHQASAGSFEDGIAAFEHADYATALRLWKQLADSGYVPAQVKAAELYSDFNKGVRDDKLAAKYFRLAADQGDHFAQYRIGLMLLYGSYGSTEVAKDENNAAKYFRLAAENGETRAKFYLGLMLAGGIGIPKDIKGGVEYVSAAANEGWASAQYTLGKYYEDGYGVPQNYSKAISLYQAAAAHGDSEGAAALGLMHYKGLGVKQDYMAAFNPASTG